MKITHGEWRVSALVALLLLSVIAGAQPGKAFGASISNVKKPGMMLGGTIDDVVLNLGCLEPAQPARGKIVPTTNNQATKQAGVK